MTIPEWQILRGRRTEQRPTLWRCTGCTYSYWSHGDAQDPTGDGHCSKGIWVADEEAIATPMPEREWWMAP